MWFECAPGSQVVDGKLVDPTPPTVEMIDQFISELHRNPNLRSDVWHRYVITRGNFKNIRNWVSKQFFFRNATPAQLDRMMDSLTPYSN